MFDTTGPGKGTAVQAANTGQPEVKSAPAPAGKETRVESDPMAQAASAHNWKPPSVDEVGRWLVVWTQTWQTQANSGFGAFANAVRADSNKSSNVGALISLAGDAVWVVGGLVDNPPAEILGAALSSIGAFVHGGSGKTDDQLLLSLQKGIDKFTDQLNKSAVNQSVWSYVVHESGFKNAGSDRQAQSFVRSKLHIPDTDNVNNLRTGIETKLIGQYLKAKHAYIEHDIAETLGGDITEDHLKGISGNVASAFTNQMGINPMPTKNGHRTANPFHLPVKDKFSFIT